jgi:hypothetical protein
MVNELLLGSLLTDETMDVVFSVEKFSIGVRYRNEDKLGRILTIWAFNECYTSRFRGDFIRMP